MTIQDRKADHINIALEKDVKHRISTGFEKICFKHCALPELDYSSIDTSVEFLGKKLSAPLLISSITGGFPAAEKINRDLTQAAEEENIAFALGSQRAMLEHPELAKTFQVRDVAPTAMIIGNIGAYQLKNYSPERIADMVNAIDANALFVHLNPLQEAIQPEGDTNWTGIFEAIEKLCSTLSVPVIAKEVGSGISGPIAKKLVSGGVKAIDVAGAGGTSWSAVEHYRQNDNCGETFWNWGIPTSQALQECLKAVKVPVIASGGIRSGLDCAKAIRMGATLCGAAQPFLEAQQKNTARQKIAEWKKELRIAMFATGSNDLSALKKAELIDIT